MGKKLFILVFLMTLLRSGSIANDDLLSDVELRNLRWDWEAYDDEAKHYVPFFKYPDSKVVRFQLDFNKYRKAHVRLRLPENYFIWIQSHLIHHQKENCLIYFSLDSLRGVYGKSKVHMFIYSPNFKESEIGASVVNKDRVERIDAEETLLKKRINDGRTNYFILISIITLSLIAILRAFYYRVFQEYTSWDKSLQQRQGFDLIIAHSPLAWPNLGFIIFYAVLIGNSIMNVALFMDESQQVLPFGLSSESAILSGFKFGGYCLLLIVLKLLLITVTSELFQIRKIRLLHFFTYFRLSLLIAIALFVFSIINGILDGGPVSEGWSLLRLLIILAWSARLILIFFVLNKIYTFRKLHLFSYLCSTELIPLLLFFKIFLK